MKRRLLSVVLTLAMVLSLIPTAAFATGSEATENDPLIYVSLGDSMTNGYGLDGYQFDMADAQAAVDDLIAILQATPDYARGDTAYVLAEQVLPQWKNNSGINNMNGVLMEADKAYPTLFKEYLESTGKEVDLIQLGMSGSRINEIYYILSQAIDGEDAYAGDDYLRKSGYLGSYNHFLYSLMGYDIPESIDWDPLNFWTQNTDYIYAAWEEYFGDAEHQEEYPGVAKATGDLYVKSVKAADIISLNAGINNFGVYILNFIENTFNVQFDGSSADMLYDYESDLNTILPYATEEEKALIDKYSVKVNLMMEEMLAELAPDAELEQYMRDFTKHMTYTYACFCVCYARALECIAELNDDVTIIMMNMINYLTDLTISTQYGDVDFGKFFGLTMDSANAYAADVAAKLNADPSYGPTILYADAGNDIELLMAELVETNGDFSGYDITRQRLLETYLFNIGMNQNFITVPDVVAYEKALAALNAGDPTLMDTFLVERDTFAAVIDGWVTWLNNLQSMIDLFKNAMEIDPTNPEWPKQLEAHQAMYDADYPKYLADLEKAEAAKAETMKMYGGYLGFEKGMIEALKRQNLNVELFLTMEESGTTSILEQMFAEAADLSAVIGAEYTDAVSLLAGITDIDGTAVGLAYADALAQTISGNELYTSMLYLLAYFKVGSGVMCHPSEDGHAEMAEAVIAAYENNTEPNPEDFVTDREDDYFPLVEDFYYFLKDNEALNTAEKVDLLEKLYSVLKGEVNLAAYPAVAAVEEIYAELTKAELISDDQTLAIVLSVYGALLDKELTNAEVRQIIGYIYFDVLAVTAAASAAAMAGSGSSSSGSGGLTPADKIAILETVFTALKNNDVLDTATYPQLGAVESLYDALTAADADGDQIVPDAVLNDIFDKIVAAVVENEEITDEVIAEVSTDVAEILLTDERIKPENKADILGAVSDALKEVGMGSVAGLPTEALDVIEKLRVALKGYFTDAQLGVIIEDVTKLIMDGSLTELEKAQLADKLHNQLLGRDDLTAAEKGTIIAIVYGVLEEAGYVDSAIAGALAYAYITAVDKGYIAGAIKGLQIAQDAIDTAKKYVNKKVPAEYAAIGELMIEELDNTAATLAKLEALLQKDPATVSVADLLAFKADLRDHLTTLSKLGYAAGVEIDPYLKKINKAVVEFNGVVEDIIDEAYAIISAVESFPEAYAAWVESIGAKVDVFSPELGALVRKYLNDNAADAMAILAVYGDEAVAKLVAEAVATYGELADVAMNLFYVMSVYGEDIYEAVKANAEVQALVEEIKAQLAKAEELVKAIEEAPFTSAYEAYVADKQAALDAAYAELVVLYNKLYTVAASVIADVDPIAAEALADAIDALCEAMGIAYDAADDYMGWLADHAEAMAGEILCAVLENTVEFVVAASPVFDQAAYDWLYNNPETVIAFFTENADEIAGLTEKYGSSVVGVIAYIGYTYGPEVLEFVINNPCESLDMFMEWYGAYGYRIWPMIDVYLEALGVYDAINEQLNTVNEMLMNLLDQVDAHILAQIAALNAALKDAHDEMRDAILAEIAALEEALKQMVMENISDKYFVTSNSYYVALGDAGAYGAAADLLAAELGMSKQYANLTTVNATAADVLAALDAAEIAKADLITLGFSANAFTAAAAADLLAAAGFDGTVSEKDWAALVGEYGAEAVAAALAELTAYVTEQVGDADIAALLTLVVESYAYSYINHLINYIVVSEEIHEINAEALLVLVGMHNPMDGVVIDLMGETLDLGEYLDYLVTVTNIFSLAYAVYAAETIYVDAPDVELAYDGSVIGVETLLTDLMSIAYGEDAKFVPTEAGYKYIQEQIYNALNPVFVDEDVECEHAFGGESTIVWTWFETEKGWDCSAYYRCAKCGEKIELICSVNAVVTKQPTVEEEGEAVYTATVEIDGVEYTSTKTVALAKLPVGPDTGDTAMVGLYVTMGLLAAAAGVVVLKKKKVA